jgi:hypothetical protein
LEKLQTLGQGSLGTLTNLLLPKNLTMLDFTKRLYIFVEDIGDWLKNIILNLNADPKQWF